MDRERTETVQAGCCGHQAWVAGEVKTGGEVVADLSNVAPARVC